MSDSRTQTSEWAVLAHLKRPQGRKGELLAEILTDFPERFQERRRLFLLAAKGEPRPIELESHWMHKGDVVLKFAGVDSINQAEELRGFDVAIPTEERAELDPDSAYISDLIGCTLYQISKEETRAVGRVSDVDRNSTQVPLLIIGQGKDELLIPFAKAYLRKLDVVNQRIEMELPEGLLTLNEPLKEQQAEGGKKHAL